MSLPGELRVLCHTVAHFLLKPSKVLFIFSPPFSLDLLSQQSSSLHHGNNDFIQGGLMARYSQNNEFNYVATTLETL